MGQGATNIAKKPGLRGRIVAYYLAMAVVTAAAFVVAFSLGASRHAEPNVAGVWALPADHPDAYLGRTFVLQQSGSFGTIGPSGNGGPTCPIRINSGRITGSFPCGGQPRPLTGHLAGPPRALDLVVGTKAVTATDTGQPLPPAGTRPVPPTSLSAGYTIVPPDPCLGSSVTLRARGAHGYALISGAASIGSLAFDSRSGAVAGRLLCPRIGAVRATGVAVDRSVTLLLSNPAGSVVDHAQLQRMRDSESLFGAFFLAAAIVMLAAQLVGLLMTKIGQPRVMGEVLAGILLGPTLLGAVAPHVEAALFPSDVIPFLSVAANLGLIFYMFLIGLELDLGSLRGRKLQSMVISNTGVALPMALGVLVAVPMYRLLGTHKSFTAFALFMGVSMSITAFPVLARILVERRMLHRPLGTLAVASAAIDDVTAWTLIAVASAAAGSAAGLGIGGTIVLTVAFVVVMGTVVRSLLSRVATAFSETGRVPIGWIVAIFAGVLLSAYVTEAIGIAIIFGAFVMGMVMPRNAGLTEDVTRRLDSFVATVLLPLFFASTGLKTNMLLLNRPDLVLITVLLCGVAILGKFGGTLLASRVSGLGWRDASVMGALLNTRGLTELIVLSLALERGVISQALFAALVVMALVTTFMTGPLLSLFDRERKLGADPAEALEAALPPTPVAAPPPQQKILVAPETPEGLGPLLAIAEPLARSQPPRELVIVRLVRASFGMEMRGGLQTEQRALSAASRDLTTVRMALAARGVEARGAAITSSDPGADIAKIAAREGVDLVLLDGRRSLLGSSIPGGATRGVLMRAEPDVVVLVSTDEHQLRRSRGRPWWSHSAAPSTTGRQWSWPRG